MWRSAKVLADLQDEIRRSEVLRYAHRLHGVLLVAKGMTYPAAAELLGDAPRTAASWVRRYRRLNQAQIVAIKAALQPQWNSKTLAAWIKQRYAIRLGARQCRRLLRKFRDTTR